jgi:hypothetical protein
MYPVELAVKAELISATVFSFINLVKIASLFVGGVYLVLSALVIFVIL